MCSEVYRSNGRQSVGDQVHEYVMVLRASVPGADLVRWERVRNSAEPEFVLDMESEQGSGWEYRRLEPYCGGFPDLAAALTSVRREIERRLRS